MFSLDGSVTSSLQWKEALAAAENTPGPLQWHLDLGLFSGLKRGLSHSGDYQALLLALDHFKNIVWMRFKERTEKVVVFQGSLDFSKEFPWDKTQEQNYRTSGVRDLRQYCRGACADYLRLLFQKMGDEMPLTVQLEADGINDPYEKALLLDPEPFSRFRLEVTGGEPWVTDAPAALCLPLTEKSAERVRALSEACKLIPESALVYSWDGLERIYYDPAALNGLAMRKLQGFCAAGGEIIPLA